MSLENPVWSSLAGDHAAFSVGGDILKAYPPAIVPVGAVAEPIELQEDDVDAVMRGRASLAFAGTLPRGIRSQRYRLEPHDPIVQMVADELREAPKRTAAEIVTLERSHVAAMLELSARVYPAYFRERTIEIGRYAGIFEGGSLVAMAGLRLAPRGYRELSGVITDPDYAGRGYAGMLVAHLAYAVAEEGRVPMLHHDADNQRAHALYEAMGFVTTRMIPMCTLTGPA